MARDLAGALEVVGSPSRLPFPWEDPLAAPSSVSGCCSLETRQRSIFAPLCSSPGGSQI